MEIFMRCDYVKVKHFERSITRDAINRKKSITRDAIMRIRSIVKHQSVEDQQGDKEENKY